MYNDAEIEIIRQRDNTSFFIGNTKDWRFNKGGLVGFGSFENTLNVVDNGVRDGGIITSSRMPAKDRTIKCSYIYMDRNDEERERCNAFFAPKEKYKMYISYAGKKVWSDCSIYRKELTTGADISALLTMTITFMFESPFWRSADDFGEDIAAKTPLIAFPYMVLPNRLTGGLFAFEKTVRVVNDGDTDTKPRAVFRSTGRVVNPVLMINDKYVRVNDVMAVGDVVEMDFTVLPPRVTKNGANFIGHCDRTSNFTEMDIPIGDVAIEYDAADGAENLSVSIFWNKLYASI